MARNRQNFSRTINVREGPKIGQITDDMLAQDKAASKTKSGAIS